MALIWIRNPDRSVTADEARFWTLGGGSLHADVTVTASGYDGTQGWTASTVNGLGIKYPRAIVDDRQFAIGCRIKLSGTPAAEKVVLAAVDASGNIQCCVTVTTARALRLYRGNIAMALTDPSADILSTGVWYKVGFKGSVDQSGGSIEAYLDGAVAVRVNNADTAAEATNIWRGIQVGFSSDWIVGHLYVVDGSGSQTDLIHGAYVKSLAPDAAGTFSGWTATGAATIYQSIDEADPDDDTTYGRSPATIGTRYTVSMATLATTRAIYGAQLSAMVRNIADSGMSASHELLTISGVTDVDPWQSVVTDEWRVLCRLWDVNPFTGAPWTVAEINATEWGGQLQA